MNIPEVLLQKIQRLSSASLLRSLQVQPENSIDFSSNDYLGMRLRMKADGQKYKLYGSGGSRLLEGHFPEHTNLEDFCCEWLKSPAALLFNSGYDANVGTLSAIGDRHSSFLYDARCHASLKDGMRLSLAKKTAYTSLEDLKQKLSRQTGIRYVVTEALFSMDGDWCPLEEIISICKTHGAWLILDESHSTGISGSGGAGLACALGLEQEVFIRIHTFGKAVGMSGAVVLSPPRIRDYLISTARSFMYSTAMPPALAEAILKACQITQAADTERAQLQANLRYWSAITQSPALSPIIPFHIPGNINCLQKAKELQASGIQAKAILGPTVAPGGERIRIILHSFNTERQMSELWQKLR